LSQEDDKILDYLHYPSSPIFDTLLKPHLPLLNKLVKTPKQVRREECPALDYLYTGKAISELKAESTYLKNHLILFSGNLSSIQIAMTHYWLHMNLDSGTRNKDKWIQRVPAAHAMTLLILQQSYTQLSPDGPPFEDLPNHTQLFQDLLKHSWYIQHSQGPPFPAIDVDKEAIGLLEHEMFETSKAAGPASFQQWGLDAGNHQNKWSPYPFVPYSWNECDIPEPEETEYQVFYYQFQNLI
jgi:hypothetical protein